MLFFDENGEATEYSEEPEDIIKNLMERHPFPSLYSLDPRTATIADAEKCLAAGADINQSSGLWNYNNVVNYYAYISDNVALVDYLFERGAEVNNELSTEDLLLTHIKNTEMFDVLLKHGMDIRYVNAEGEGVLYFQLCDDVDFIRYLLDKGADPSEQPYYVGCNYIVEEALERCNNTEVIKLLIERGGSFRKKKMLSYISKTHDLKKALALPETGRFNKSELFTFLCSKYSDVFLYFSKTDIDVNYSVRAWQGMTPIIMAMAANDKDVLNWLTDHGAKATPEMFFDVLKRGNAFAVDVLLKNGFDPNMRVGGKTPLMIAAEYPKIIDKTYCDYRPEWLWPYEIFDRSCFDLLIKANVNINARDNDGRTALMYASDRNRVNALLKAGADPYIRDKDGKTALDIFIENDKPNQSKGIGCLLKRMRNLTQTNKNNLLYFLLFGKRKKRKALLNNIHCRLHGSETCSFAELVRDLVKIGADMNAVVGDEKRNPDRLSIYEPAVADKNPETLRSLINATE